MRAKVRKAVPPDLVFENHFSLFLIRPGTVFGQVWLNEHISGEAQRFGDAIVCEPRYVGDIFGGATSDGLNCVHGGLLQ